MLSFCLSADGEEEACDGCAIFLVPAVPGESGGRRRQTVFVVVLAVVVDTREMHAPPAAGCCRWFETSKDCPKACMNRIPLRGEGLQGFVRESSRAHGGKDENAPTVHRPVANCRPGCVAMTCSSLPRQRTRGTRRGLHRSSACRLPFATSPPMICSSGHRNLCRRRFDRDGKLRTRSTRSDEMTARYTAITARVIPISRRSTRPVRSSVTPMPPRSAPGQLTGGWWRTRSTLPRPRVAWGSARACWLRLSHAARRSAFVRWSPWLVAQAKPRSRSTVPAASHSQADSTERASSMASGSTRSSCSGRWAKHRPPSRPVELSRNAWLTQSIALRALSKTFKTCFRSWPRLRVRPSVATTEKAPCFAASLGFFSMR